MCSSRALFPVAPQIAPFAIGEEPANWGEQVSAMCSILKGDSPIEIGWSLNGESITRASHPDVTITKTGRKTSVLIIESVTAHHAGEYTCVASNLVGSVSRSAVLSVNGTTHQLTHLARFSIEAIPKAIPNPRIATRDRVHLRPSLSPPLLSSPVHSRSGWFTRKAEQSCSQSLPTSV